MPPLNSYRAGADCRHVGNAPIAPMATGEVVEPAPGTCVTGKYGGVPVTRSKHPASSARNQLVLSRMSACRTSQRPSTSAPLYCRERLAIVAESSCASIPTTLAAGNRHAVIIITEPIPVPRSSARAGECARLRAAVHAVTTSSVVYRCPPTRWKMRQPPVRKHSSSPRPGCPTPAAGGPGTPSCNHSGGTQRRSVTTPASPACSRCFCFGGKRPAPAQTAQGGGFAPYRCAYATGFSRRFRCRSTPVPSHFQHAGPCTCWLGGSCSEYRGASSAIPAAPGWLTVCAGAGAGAGADALMPAAATQGGMRRCRRFDRCAPAASRRPPSLESRVPGRG